MVAETMRELLNDARIEVVEDPEAEHDLEAVVERTGANLLVVPSDADGLRDPVKELLDRRADLRVLGLVEHGRTGVLWELRPVRRTLGELTKATFVGALEERERV